MKETTQHNRESVQVVAQAEQATRKEYKGTLRLKKGMKLYELNLKTQEIKEAQYQSITAQTGRLGAGVRKALIMQPNCLYEAAINQQNAQRKFGKMVKKIVDKITVNNG